MRREDHGGSVGGHLETVNDSGYTTQFTHFTGKSNAEQQTAGNLQAGMLLTRSMVQICADWSTRAAGADERKPCKMVFQSRLHRAG